MTGSDLSAWPDAETFARYLGRLDDDELAAFVVALWEARGWDVAREDGLVRASDGATTRLLAPVAGGRLGREPSLPADAAVDAVVTTGLDDGAAASLATDRGADLLDARDLGRMLHYALDREVAASLCAAHLGTAPGEMRPPLRRRTAAVRARLPAAGTVLSVGLALVAIAGVVWLLTAGGSLTGDQPTPAAAGPVPDDPDDPGSVTPTDTGPSGAESVPGLSTAGVTDLTELAAAHEAYLRDRSYRQTSAYRGPDPRNRTQGFVVRNIAIETDESDWRRKVTTLWETDDGRERRVEETYFDGDAGYIARYNGEGFTYEPADQGEGEVVLLDPAVVSDQTVRRYLAVPDTRVTDRVDTENGRLYEVRGSGTPSARGLDGVEDYTVQALVHEDGYVVSMRATYLVETPNGTREASFSVDYGEIGETAVDAPTWYERRWGGDPGTEGTTVTPSDDAGDTVTTPETTATPTA